MWKKKRIFSLDNTLYFMCIAILAGYAWLLFLKFEDSNSEVINIKKSEWFCDDLEEDLVPVSIGKTTTLVNRYRCNSYRRIDK